MFVRIGERHVNVESVKEFEVVNANEVVLVTKGHTGSIDKFTLTENEAFMFLHDVKRLGLAADLNYSSGLEDIWERGERAKSLDSIF